MKLFRVALVVLPLLTAPALRAAAATPPPPAATTPPAVPAAPAAPAPVEDGWPDSPAGALARDWVRAFGAGEDSMAACLTRHLSPESLVKRPMSERLTTYRRLHESLGTLALFAVDHESPTELKVTLVAADLSKHGYTFTVQPEAPWYLVSVKTTETMHGLPGFGWLHH